MFSIILGLPQTMGIWLYLYSPPVCLPLTWQCQQGFKVSAVCDPSAVFGAGVPEVLILSIGDNYTAMIRRHPPVIVG